MNMNRKWLVIIVLVAAAAIIFAAAYRPGRNGTAGPAAPGAVSTTTFDPLNATYMIDRVPVTLVNGKASMSAAPGSAARIITNIFGEPATGDLNGDGVPDAAILLTQDAGGSGTFFYVAAAINTSGTAQGTDAYFLGDRIAPQNIAITNGEIVTNYAVRAAGEPMTTQPSIGTTTYLVLKGSSLVPGGPMTDASVQY